MVKVRKYSCLLAVSLIVSCMTNPIGYNSRRYGDAELFGLNLESVLEAYNSTYGRFPDSSDDMVVFIDQITDSDYAFYQDQRAYFLRNKNKLIFVKDSLLNIYYEKQDAKHCVVKIRASNPCEKIKTARTTFFDDRGYFVRNDSLAEQVKRRTLHEFHKYLHIVNLATGTIPPYRLALIEYTPEGLRNLCDDEAMPARNSIFDYLDSLARSKRFSRITLPGFVCTNTNEQQVRDDRSDAGI